MMQHPSKSTVQAVSPVSVYLCKLSLSASQILHVHSYTINFFKPEKQTAVTITVQARAAIIHKVAAEKSQNAVTV